ncbi:MAG TPA: universal stress protein [Acidobacteriaceae bacterium]
MPASSGHHSHSQTTVLRGAQRFPFRTIVAATDFSEESSAALACAQALAQAQHARLLLIHVIDPVGYAFPEGAPAAVKRDKAAREELARIEAEVREHGIPVHSRVETGIVCERILLSLRDHKAALLVLGTRAVTSAGRAALGRVMRQLLTEAPCPILTVAPDDSASPRNFGHWHNVLAATDFSLASLSALHYAQRIAGRHLILMHTARCGRHEDCPNCLERLRFLAPFNESHTIPVDHVVTGGEPAEEIVKAAQRLGPDLIVLGAPSPEHQEHDLEQSTVAQVVAAVRCPVLIVPESREKYSDELIEDVQEQPVVGSR